jgi:hypothetical protein
MIASSKARESLSPDVLDAFQRIVGRLISGIHFLTMSFEPHAQDKPPAIEELDEDQEAALLLGVDVEATEVEIRSALRAQLRATGLHPDQGGDADGAKNLIAAQNRLIARARLRHGATR